MQHDLWADQARAAWTRAGIGPGMTVVDLGCGPGFALRELAALVGEGGSAIGVDVSRGFVEHAQAYASEGGPGGARASVRTVHGDAHALTLDDAIADAAYLRWVLSFTPEPERVIGELARVLSNGGRVVIQDYVAWTNLLWAPFDETLAMLRRSILSMYGAQGADSNVGRRLPALLEAHGFAVEEVSPVHRIARPGEAMWAWPSVFFRTFLPKVVEAGHMTQAEYEAWDAEWRRLEETPGAFFLTPPQVEIIATRRASV